MARCKGRPGKSRARRPGEVIDALIPILPDAERELKLFGHPPRIERVRRYFDIADAEAGGRRKQRFRKQLAGQSQNLIAGAAKIAVVTQPVGVDANLDLMRARQLEFRRVSVNQALVPRGLLRGVEELISAVAGGRNHIQVWP